MEPKDNGTEHASGGGIVNYFQGATIHNLVINGNMTKSGQDHFNGMGQKDRKLTKYEQIMEYVGRLKPLVQPSVQERYDTLWASVLELQEVSMMVYNPGKQQGTTFNRDLVAQIAHLMGSRVYTDTKAVQMAELLEPGKGKDHPVRQRLSENPDGNVKKAVEQLFCESCES